MAFREIRSHNEYQKAAGNTLSRPSDLRAMIKHRTLSKEYPDHYLRAFYADPRLRSVMFRQVLTLSILLVFPVLILSLLVGIEISTRFLIAEEISGPLATTLQLSTICVMFFFISLLGWWGLSRLKIRMELTAVFCIGMIYWFVVGAWNLWNVIHVLMTQGQAELNITMGLLITFAVGLLYYLLCILGYMGFQTKISKYQSVFGIISGLGLTILFSSLANLLVFVQFDNALWARLVFNGVMIFPMSIALFSIYRMWQQLYMVWKHFPEFADEYAAHQEEQHEEDHQMVMHLDAMGEGQGDE